ncbi:hypothetical protein TSUD_232640 [Trifolium subterraneum]|uniref:non-specific serine/threonine protein kinase n=1 Tax=Trifolium subterraneum TaxID=3900 RepID=A0A2Z6MH12_TRISU|nr:hypothetical protein TSUD_232640 [Trifolium subterraneum]
MGICTSKSTHSSRNFNTNNLQLPPTNSVTVNATSQPQTNSVNGENQNQNENPSIEENVKRSPFFPFYSPSPAHQFFSKMSPARKFFKKPFPPPSPAKHIRSLLARRHGSIKPNEASIPEGGEEETVSVAALDKNFGFSKHFGSKYDVGDEVGRGHFGYTCAARLKKGDLKGQQVAVKVIPKAKDVRREVKILRALNGHKNLVRFYEAYEDNANVYIVMELCEGGELLDRILSRGGKYTEEDAKAILRQILNAAAFCHLQGVVHRDLKPENFLFASTDENSELKAIDFGLSDFVKLDPSFDEPPWPSLSDEARDFVKRLLNKDPRKRMSAAQALTKVDCCRNTEKQPALSKTLTEDELVYLKEQFALLEPNKNGTISLENIQAAFTVNATDAMKESRIADFLASLNALQYRRMGFDEFCAATLSVHQLEALDHWEKRARCAFDMFEKDGNKAIVIDELASELGLGPSIPVHAVLHDWIRHTDGKLSFLGFVKLLHGPSRSLAKAQ